MAERVVQVAATNIISPLGLTAEANYAAVKRGESALRRYEGKWGLPEPFVASLTDRNQIAGECEREGIGQGYTYFEQMLILSIVRALRFTDVDITSPRTLLILSTTKGNIDLMRQPQEGIPMERIQLGETARVVARFFGNRNQPVVVSNACISGATAQIEAARLIKSGSFDSVVVCGADVQSPFIITGFQSLKALSAQPCRPFDEDRTGINLGEAAATIIYKVAPQNPPKGDTWQYFRGCMRNDAYHISSPSREGEGCYRAMHCVMQGVEAKSLAFVNAHGTGTFFNDEMEAVAIGRAGLGQVPVNSLKGYVGHTMGAAGVLETILSMAAVDDGLVLGTRGFESLGVSSEVSVSAHHRQTRERAFLKLMSGFGGCNAALLLKKN